MVSIVTKSWVTFAAHILSLCGILLFLFKGDSMMAVWIIATSSILEMANAITQIWLGVLLLLLSHMQLDYEVVVSIIIVHILILTFAFVNFCFLCKVSKKLCEPLRTQESVSTTSSQTFTNQSTRQYI